jgi:hypothetical protein
LLRHQSRSPIRFPRCDEEFSKESVQRLFDAVFLIAATVLLVLKTGEIPSKNEEGAFGGLGLGCGSEEQGGVLGPVGGEFDGGLGSEDEGWCSDVGKVSAYGCYGL